MIEKLEYGKSYAIYLNSLYGGYKSNVRIIGKTNIDNVVSNNDDDYNIYKTYFIYASVTIAQLLMAICKIGLLQPRPYWADINEETQKKMRKEKYKKI